MKNITCEKTAPLTTIMNSEHLPLWLVLSKHNLIKYTQNPYGIDIIISPWSSN